MSQSLKARFNGQSKEVIEYTRLWGRFQAMDKYGVGDYVSFCRFIEEATNDANFGLHPALNQGLRGAWAEDLLDAFTTKILKMETQRQQLAAKVDSLERELEYFKGQKAITVEPRVSKVMQLCRE